MRTLLVLAALALVAVTCPADESPQPQVTASSGSDVRYPAEAVFDGNLQTRWASAALGTGSQWVQVDLGHPVPIDRLDIHWEHAYALTFNLQLSDDGKQWRSAYSRRTGADEVTHVTGLGTSARFVRLMCTKAGPWPHVSVWEITSPDPATAAAFREATAAFVRMRDEQRQRARQYLSGVMKERGAREIVFAVRKPGSDGHWYANFSYYAGDASKFCFQPGGGQLCALDPITGSVRVVFEDPLGAIRDPAVSYDGQRIVFSYLRGGETHYHLWSIGADGKGLRQLTDGDCDDIEPVFIPDGGIAFCSSRCNRWVNCWLTQVAIIYRCDADGGNMRPISCNTEQDNTPWPLPDGRLLYMRWEYVDRSQMNFHHLWTMNPDGTNQQVFFGNFNPGTAMLDAKPIPGTSQVVAVFSPGHGRNEHAGAIQIVDPGNGPDDLSFTRRITTDEDFRDPFALDADHFLAARGPEIQLVGSDGLVTTIYRLPDSQTSLRVWCHEPRLLGPHPREEVITPRVDLTRNTGTLLLSNVYEGRNMQGVKPGDISKLLVLELLPKPINYTGGMDPITLGGSFTLERVVGTVPVEPDGSAYFDLPALRSFFFVALDDQNRSVKRMHSFLTVQPGEVTGCVGCHETRTQVLPLRGRPLALQREPSAVEPVAGVPDVFDFPRDIQPILDRNCLRCHDWVPHEGSPEGPRAGKVILSGDRGPMYSHSYFTLTATRQFADGRNRVGGSFAPRTIGAVASPIMAKLTGGHHGVQATAQEVETVRYWIESGAPYPGTYAALGCGSIGGNYQNSPVETDYEWPTTKAGAAILSGRCATCHTDKLALPKAISDPAGRPQRHILFNLTRPTKSLLLLAPLGRSAGGLGICRDPKGDAGPPIFADTKDPDYQTLLAMCAEGKRRLEEMGRFDMPGFRPTAAYLREMHRYGVLAEVPAPGEAVDAYALDRAYWQSLWWQPRPTPAG